MTDYKELQTIDEWSQAKEQSRQQPVIVFKHSTTCPISARAYDEYVAFLQTETGIDGYLVKVIENRDVSNKIEIDTGVKHESPQIFLIQNKKVLWHTSHANITTGSIKEALQTVGA
ncbi:MAG TPA: bacillithiol system redox-active protein YtxJ [Bacillota bacterium]|nr:bacillithiol system redox-active protein YtxJ [Bacillota bacterium]